MMPINQKMWGKPYTNECFLDPVVIIRRLMFTVEISLSSVHCNRTEGCQRHIILSACIFNSCIRQQIQLIRKFN